ncbi:MFS general substrate transporter [Dacryopinax primogenitus]|uniref:MFS general substrate transporter n=1 Tax=Dacryopinax primogenitus (strain DJM 731) TaxID=1858805 RepID=M5G7I1_DACPD|nr:MFS general substrate transporter [Dacryopinax primogenitus]EJT99722.1 MFS general substrate transporter [Dacryopinax primogenitus]
MEHHNSESVEPCTGESPSISLSRDVTAVDLPSLLPTFTEKEQPKCESDAPAETADIGIHSQSEKTLSDGNAVPVLVDEDSLETEDDDWTYPEGGRGWWVVTGCAIIAAVTLGWGLAWGVFQSYYKEHLFPDVPDSVLSVLGSIPGTIMNPIAFVVGKFADKYGYRLFLTAGCVVAVLAMLTASFSTTLWQFFLTQGLLQGCCTGLILPIAMAAPSQWFLRRRALATGIVIAGSSFGGGLASLVAQQLLTHIGLRNTLLTYTGVHAVLMSSSLLMIRDRPHPKSPRFTHARIQWVDASLFRRPLFWLVALSVTISTLGYLGPYFYIEQYTLTYLPSLDPALASLPAAMMNFSAAIGRSLIGLLADKIGVLNAFIGSLFIAGCMQLLVWNFAHSFGTIMTFSVLDGFFGAAFISLISVLGAKLFGVRNLATLSAILMIFSMPGQAAGGPLVGAILAASGGWQAPITYSGLCCVVGALVMIPARFVKEKRVLAVF